MCSESEWLVFICFLLEDGGMFQSSLDMNKFLVFLTCFSCNNFMECISAGFHSVLCEHTSQPPEGDFTHQLLAERIPLGINVLYITQIPPKFAFTH